MEKLLAELMRIKSRYRKYFLMAADFCLTSVCYWFTWVMLMGRISLVQYLPTMFISWGVFSVCFFVSFLIFGMYESLWRYAEAHEFFKCCVATLVAAGVFTVGTLIFLQPPMVPYRVPYSVYFLSALLAGMSTLYLRMFYRAYRHTKTGGKISSGAQKVLLVGAGDTGNAVLQDIKRAPNSQYDIVCVVDDDVNKQGRRVQGIKIDGSTKDIPRLVEKHGVKVIIIALPSAPNKQKRRIVNICAKTKCQLKKVPDLYAFVTDTKDIISQLHSVSVEDLLGREVIGKNPAAYLVNRTVMVTGGGGSIGSELCRQIAACKPKRLIIVDIYENNAYAIQQELVRKYGDKLNLQVMIASVRDTCKMEALFERFRPEIVYHAAAHKHVPLMEDAPEEAVKNNIFGTLNTARCASKFGVKRFVMISTDKAVNPTNVMGATKRACEMVVQCMNQISQTEFVAVRFGNVLGSNGSVIPLFKEQIASGGPLTVTDPEIIRYFMTIPEAVSLVLTAGEMAHGGEIFVLDMGEPVKILELAENLIRLSGLEPYKDIQIEFTGLRPGEKLYEELLMDEEGLKKTPNDKVFIGESIDISPTYLFNYLEEFKPIAYSNDSAEVVKKLHELVPTFACPAEHTQQKAVKLA